MANYVRNWNGDLEQVNWVYCNHCGCQFVEEVHDGKCPECGTWDNYCTAEEVEQAEQAMDLEQDRLLESQELEDFENWAGGFEY